MTGFVSPNHTQTPNDLFDEWLPKMREAELKIVLHAIRQTIGFHRGSDAISFSQFMKATGLSRQGVSDGISKAKEHGLLSEVSRGKRGLIVYRLVYNSDQSNELTSTSQENRPIDPLTGLQSRHTKESIKETGKKTASPKTATNSKKLRTAQRSKSSPTPYSAPPPPPSTSGMAAQFDERKLYYSAFEMAFPPDVRPKVRDTDKNRMVAQFLYANGYQLYEAAECVTEKIGNGRADYRFEYLQEDLPRWRLKQKQKTRSATNGATPVVPAPIQRSAEELAALRKEVIES